MREKTDQFVLRLPEGMRDKLKIVAAANRRSMNSEVVMRIESSLEKDAPEKAKAE